MYVMYVLKSLKDEKLYIGFTSNLKRRLSEHNEGKSPSTKGRGPFELRYCEIYKSKNDAKRREKSLKKNGKAWAQLKKRIEESLQ